MAYMLGMNPAIIGSRTDSSEVLKLIGKVQANSKNNLEMFRNSTNLACPIELRGKYIEGRGNYYFLSNIKRLKLPQTTQNGDINIIKNCSYEILLA